MPVNTKELIETLSVLADDHNIRVAVKNSLMGSFIMAGATFIGGVALGRAGVFVGAAAGSVLSYATSGKVLMKLLKISHLKFHKFLENFKSASTVFQNDFNEEQKQKLYRHIVEGFKEFELRDLEIIVALLKRDDQAQAIAIKNIKEFLENELKMQIID